MLTNNDLFESLAMSCDGIEESVGYDPWLFAILGLDHMQSKTATHSPKLSLSLSVFLVKPL